MIYQDLYTKTISWRQHHLNLKQMLLNNRERKREMKFLPYKDILDLGEFCLVTSWNLHMQTKNKIFYAPYFFI